MNNVIQTRFTNYTDYECRTCSNNLNIDEADEFMLCHACYCILFDPTRTDFALVKKESLV